MKKLSNGDISYNTTWALSELSHLRKLVQDIDQDTSKERRLASRKCKRCYYVKNVGTCDLKKTECSVCEGTFYTSSYGGMSVCTTCADKHGLCVNCGADRELKHRRKGWIPSQ